MNQTNDADNATTLRATLGNGPYLSVLNVLNLDTVLGAGVNGFGASVGVIGSSTTGIGMWGSAANGRGGWFKGGVADLMLGGDRSAAPTGDAVAHTRGEIAFAQGLSNSGDFWACVQSGTPGVWRRLTGYTSAGSLTVLSVPVRVYDSRAGQVPTGIGPKTPLALGVDRVVDTSGNVSGVPADASAVLINLTAVDQNGAGFLSVRANGTTYGGHSNINFAANTAIATMCLSRCASSDIAIRLGGLATTCNIAVDVVGYFR
jgi:hypothetical protein